MKRASWRILGTMLVLALGVGVGMSFPWGRAQDSTPATGGDEKQTAKEGDADKKDKGEAPGECPCGVKEGAGKGKTLAELARERMEIVEEEGRFTITIYFPNKEHPKRTRWKVTCSTEKAGTMAGPRENLVIHYAFFQPSPEVPEVQVLGQTYIAESLVAYSDGVRFYDIAHHSSGLYKAIPSDLGDRAFTIDKSQKIVCEVRDRGIHWKRGGDSSRRGEELVIWGTLPAGNYLYICQFGFHDDGTIQARMGATGSNLSSHVGTEKSHTHVAVWRVDVDFGERTSNEVHLVRHREPFGKASHSTQVIEPFNGGREGFADWSDKEFTTLRIVNPKMKGAHGRFAAYDMISYRTGSARHFGDSPDETFTHHDYYVMEYKEDKTGAPAEVDCSKLLSYVRGADNLKGKDIVLWHISSVHHVPRQEDMFGGSTGSTPVVWSGFDLKPRDLFDGTPFYGAAKTKEKEKKKGKGE